MGGCTFFTQVRGDTAQKAFNSAVQDACFEHGNGGYTGTIAEKSEFVLIEVPEGTDPHSFAHELIEESDERIDDKWGPAGCIQLDVHEFLFFGWASE